MTICIQIGNTDDKLTQAEWCQFVAQIHQTVQAYAGAIHGTFYSAPAAPWQNACWVFDISRERTMNTFCKQITDIARLFQQDSVAMLRGDTEFLKTGRKVEEVNLP